MLSENTNLNENYKNSYNPLQYIGKYYYIFLGITFVLITLMNCLVKIIPVEYSGYILLIAFTCFTVVSDINKQAKVKTFLIIAIPFLIVISIIFVNGNTLWHNVLRWEMGRNIIFNLNSFFNSIPFNDGAFARIFKPSWLTVYMKMVYNTGFVLAVIVPLFRAFLCIDFKSMLKYTLSAHIFQVIIITPFYTIFFLQEIWFVRGHTDMLARDLNPSQTLETVLNCFPSMHTSIAFAMFLLVIRERNKIFKWVWGFYCLSIIYSTMYLEIHWIIDILGGLLLGYATVKLVDFVILKSEVYFSKHFKNVINKDLNDTLINE